jgi:uncharacterized membrane-anchored protein
MTGKRLIAAAIAVAILQIGFLGWIIAGRAAILRNGTEVLLKVEPVDPRDLLRGDYIALGYEISRIPASLVNAAPLTEGPDDGTVYVRLKKQDNGFWGVSAAYVNAPPKEPIRDGEVEMQGKQAYFVPPEPMRVDYGIERFYLPEGEGLAIQNDMRVRPFGMKVAVSKSGQAQIKALMDGDRTLFEEPLY